MGRSRILSSLAAAGGLRSGLHPLGGSTMVEITTLDGARANLAASEIAALRGRLGGPLLAPGDDAYDTARRVWNGNVDRRPALIARARDAADVHHAVNFARNHGVL